jgi:hypothetical protein
MIFAGKMRFRTRFHFARIADKEGILLTVNSLMEPLPRPGSF